MDRRWGSLCAGRLHVHPKKNKKKKNNKKVNYVFVTMVCVWLEATGGHCLVGRRRIRRRRRRKKLWPAVRWPASQPSPARSYTQGRWRPQRCSRWWMMESLHFFPFFFFGVCSTHNDILYMQRILSKKTEEEKKGTWWWCWHRLRVILLSSTILRSCVMSIRCILTSGQIAHRDRWTKEHWHTVCALSSLWVVNWCPPCAARWKHASQALDQIKPDRIIMLIMM